MWLKGLEIIKKQKNKKRDFDVCTISIDYKKKKKKCVHVEDEEW